MANERMSFEIREGVNITDEVMMIIAGLAACEPDGIVSLNGNLTSDNIIKAGMSKLSKGIRIVPNDDESLSVRLAINICYGYDLPGVCKSVQEKVKSSIENMTGLRVKDVDIRIASVSVAQ